MDGGRQCRRGGGGGGGGGGGVATDVDEDPPPPPHATNNVVESKREKTVRKFFMPLVKRKRCKNTNHTILVSITRRDLSPEPVGFDLSGPDISVQSQRQI